MLWIVSIIGSVISLLVGVAIGTSFSPSKESIDLWNMVGTWFAGIATTCVGALALWFQHRAEEERKPKLTYKTSGIITGHHSEALICLSITSNGQKKVKVSSVLFSVSAKQNMVPPLAEYSNQFGDHLLEFSDTLNFLFSPSKLGMHLASAGLSVYPVVIIINSTIGSEEHVLSSSETDVIKQLVSKYQALGYTPENHAKYRAMGVDIVATFSGQLVPPL